MSNARKTAVARGVGPRRPVVTAETAASSANL